MGSGALLQRYDSRGAHRSKRICFSISLVSQVQQDALYQAGLLVPLDVPVAGAGGSAAQPRFGLRPIAAHLGARKLQTGAFHDLRHTFATLALQNGMDVKTLSAMLGHVSAATTLDIYTHATSDMQHAAARKIDCGIGKAELPDEPAPR